MKVATSCYFNGCCYQNKLIVVMGRTPFYRSSNELEHHFSNIEQTGTYLSIGDQTRLWTSNKLGLSLELLNYSSTWLEHHFSNIKRIWTCSSIGNRTRTPYFWLRTIEHRTSNIVRPITSFKRNWIVSNYLSFSWTYPFLKQSFKLSVQGYHKWILQLPKIYFQLWLR